MIFEYEGGLMHSNVEVVTMTNDGAKITKNTLKLTQKTRWELAQKQSQ